MDIGMMALLLTAPCYFLSDNILINYKIDINRADNKRECGNIRLQIKIQSVLQIYTIMKNNKFINQLADDVIKENQHLKNEIIKVRKQHKGFEDLMITELIKAHPSDEEFKGFVFDSAEQCLKYFVNLVGSNLKLAEKHKQQTKIIKRINIDLEEANINATNELKELKLKLKQKENELRNFKGENIEKIQLLQAEMQEKQKRIRDLIEQMAKYELEAEEKIEQIRIESLEEKKKLIEDTNRQKILFRKKVQAEIWELEKRLKNQIDRKDKETKGLLQTLTNMTENGQIENQNVLFLQTMMKPFTDHTALNQKISELRKQNINFKNQYRVACTQVLTVESQYNETLTQVQIHKTRIQRLEKENAYYQSQYDRMKIQLEKSNEDKENMEKYYDEKWSRQFLAVKTNLQKKYDIKITTAQRQYDDKKYQLEQEKRKLVRERTNYYSHLAQLQAQVTNEKATAVRYQQQFEVQFEKSQQKSKQIKQMALMHQEEVSMITYNSTIKVKGLEQRIQNHILDNEQLQKEKLQQQIHYQSQIMKLEKKYTKEIEDLEKFQQMRYNDLKQAKQKQIWDLRLKFQELKIHVDSVKKEYFIMVEEEKKKAQEVKEQSKEKNKVDIQKAVIREKQVNIELSLRLADMKKDKANDRQEYEQKQKRFQRKMQEKDKIIEQYEKQMKSIDKVSSIYEVEANRYKAKILDLQYEIKSMNILLNSRNLQIQNINMEMRELLDEKRQWEKSLKEIKREFKEGFIQLKDICEKRINFYKSKIWDLEKITNQTTTQRDFDRIRSLTEEKKKLEDKVEMKEAQNLILKEVKGYYESKIRDQDSKMMINYGLKESHPVMIKRPNKKRIKNLRSQSRLSQFGINKLKNDRSERTIERKGLKTNSSLS